MHSGRLPRVSVMVPNILGLVTFSCILGAVLSNTAQNKVVVLNFFIHLSNGTMLLTEAIMWYVSERTLPTGKARCIEARSYELPLERDDFRYNSRDVDVLMDRECHWKDLPLRLELWV